MATAGNPNPNPNQPGGGGAFDMQMLFKPTNPPQSPSFAPSSPYPYPTPPPPGPYSYPPHTHTTPPFHHFLPSSFAHDPLANVHPHRPLAYAAPSPSRIPSPSPSPNPGARLMALLTPPSPSAPAAAVLPPQPAPELSMTPSAPPVSLAGLAQVASSPVRLPSSKLPKGRHLVGEHVVYDVDVRLPGEIQPQLEVTPITKYVSDPGLVVGRQIAVNRSYICYGLKLGAIRVLNINTALRSLLRGHAQRVSDMAFFAEDVHLLASVSIDGRVVVWKINEGPDEEDRPQITGKTIVALHIIGDGESFHPRVCWHSHKQEVLVVGIGKHVLKIDTTKVGKGEVMSVEKPLNCPVEKLVDGVQFIGKHEGEVTDLSMCQWMTTRLVSASTDGTIKIWEDRKALPLVTLRPHNGEPVNSATFLGAPHRPDHIVLITGGHLNREVKMWASASEEGWLLPSDAESWQCTQTLDLRSSAEPRAEGAFFNQVVVLSQSGLILLANAKRNAIYAVHIDYGPHPSATHMDYIAEFTVTMPILSLTGTSDCSPDEAHIVQVYCVQTQAIQQYALDLSHCLPPPVENTGIEKDSGVSRAFEAPISDGFSMLEPSHGNTPVEKPLGSATSRPESTPAARYPVFSGALELPNLEVATSTVESKTSANVDNVNVASSPLPSSPRFSGRLSGFRSPSNGFEQVPPIGDLGVDQSILDYSVDRGVDSVPMNLPDIPSSDDGSGKSETRHGGQNDISILPNPTIPFKHPTHLVTPSEIISAVVSSSENTHIVHDFKGEETMIQDVVVNDDMENAEVEVNVVGESGSVHQKEFSSAKNERVLCPEEQEKSFYNQVGDVGVYEALERPSNAVEEEVQDSVSSVPGKAAESVTETTAAQSPLSAVKGKKPKGKPAQVSGSLSPSPSSFNSTDSSNEPGSTSSAPSTEAIFSHILAMQETINQLLAVQKEMQKQMAATVTVPVNKEGRRIETALGRSMEKALKANFDALWARLQEEYAKREKLERERMQQITSLSNYINKDLPAMIEKTLKKELSAVGPALARSITPVIEKTISSAIIDSFQRGVGDKAVGQLEKSVSSKLEATIARQIQAQFQTSVKQALQDALRSNLEASLIPAFEMSCKAMFEQVDTAFQKGMVEHTAASQQQFDATLSPLAHALRDAMNSATSFTQTLTGELADSQRRFLALVAAGANPKAINPLAAPQSNGLGGGEMIEPPLDPKVELQRLISEHKFGEAFTAALQRSDVSIVSWLCSQVDLQGILSTVPLPLNQGVLLALLQQLACDINNDLPRKLEWMSDVAVAINPVDQVIAMHVRPIFEQVYQILEHQLVVPTTAASDARRIRLVMHVINSVLTTCK
ncbi:enhancer of mRNA-decapping protein 4 [Cinnamomum micranthum f. kanehirae]|uniref:Enhancer of mRNA-decapping protein 4 n=1 Tax=Cinnamomum micranthum f. kanehirae TaxID=337451 RepID=A0A3S3N9K6_9MAGN|nr:enhancer of mRNA-decapping protein 4 [Cinnamomum micranthum f. kanehirae]